MADLGNVYHNFPLLAKQSGFKFHLHRGRVNWSEIENLDINEIVERRNFELLEQNLVNVTCCNLEIEYDSKILDQNLVKLFKLAQLGVDYLSYCEIYLDRCVVLLQEQLIASQDECEILKKEIEKRKEVNRSRSKNRTINYQCEKCAKVFISDVYLKFHEKRRHSNIGTPESFDGSSQKCQCGEQKNEDTRKFTKSTQTVFSEEVAQVTQEKEDANVIEVQNLIKVEKLEHELQDLKERFKKTENTLSEKTEVHKLNAFHSINVPNSMQYNSVFMLLPSYLTHLGNGYCEITSCSQTSTPEVCQPSRILPGAGNSAIANNVKLVTENMSEFKNESGVSAKKQCEALEKEKTDSNVPKVFENFQKYPSGAEELECEKENVDPKIKAHLFTNLTKPVPPPRKLKKGIREHSESEITAVAKIDSCEEKKTDGLSNHFIVRSNPAKELEEETNPEIFAGSMGNISEINKFQANSTESLQSKKSVTYGSESKSFIKNIVKRDSPSIQKLSQNFKKSLNSLCDSVSFTEKEMKKKETNFQNLRAAVVNGLNNHLQQLGISSEWSGIPRKTMRQKLSAWKYRRRLSSKENPLYPIIRQNIEEKIFQKLKKNFKRKKTTATNKLNRQESVKSTSSEIPNILFENKSVCFMYDSDTDSESRVSDFTNFYGKEQSNSQKTIIVEEITSSEEGFDAKKDKESDTLFLPSAGGSSFNNVTEESDQKPILVNKRDKLFVDSDTDSSFLENFDPTSLKSFKKFLGDELTDNDIETKNYESEESQFKLPCRGKVEAKSQSILKDKKGFQPKPITNAQKKVLFAKHSKETEEELSEDPNDDDLWSLKSDKEEIAS